MFELYKGKKVFVTGHTGFKGTWLSKLLINLGAEVTGYSLSPPTEPALFNILNLEKEMKSITADVRDYHRLNTELKKATPEIVIHLAAQSIVRESYNDPRHTYETNVMGTVNILDSIRSTESVKSFLNITTDKVYENRELQRGYFEEEPLDGDEPYSNSKSCSELVTRCYKRSFFSDRKIAISTARAGNVIGGGDFATDRIVPDCVRAVMQDKKMVVRNPKSIRPYQHVLEPISAYLMIAERQYNDLDLSGYYNVGPDEKECISTEELVTLFQKSWGEGFDWIVKNDGGPHETNYLKLDNNKIKNVFGWEPKWGIDKAIQKTVDWTKCWFNDDGIKECMDFQIDQYIGEFNE